MSYTIDYSYDGVGPYNAIIDSADSEQDAIALLKRRVKNPQLLEIIDIQLT